MRLCGSSASVDEFLHRVRALPQGTFHFTSATGATHLMMETMSVMMSGDVRVGSEDEPYLAPEVLGTNEEHVSRIARISRELGREVASVEDARQLLQIWRR